MKRLERPKRTPEQQARIDAQVARCRAEIAEASLKRLGEGNTQEQSNAKRD